MLEFEPKTHTYRWDGAVVPHVTQILSRVGTRRTDDSYWSSISGAEFAQDERACRFGDAFHRYAALKLAGKKFTYNPEMEPWIRGWEKFRREHDYFETAIWQDRPVIERPMYCSRYRYAMTPDWVVMADGSPILVDWKTGTAWQNHWWWQCAAYVCGLEENTGWRYTKVMVVRVFEDDYDAREHSHEQIRFDLNRFMSVRNVYRSAT